MRRLLLLTLVLLNSSKPTWPQTGVPTVSSLRSTATVTLGSNQVVTTANGRGVFSLVGLQPDQTVGVKVQYVSSAANHVISGDALDGGQVLTGSQGIVVAADGTFSFQFHAGQSPGLYRLTLRDGNEAMSLQFWVLDPSNAQNNPGCITAAKPNG